MENRLAGEPSPYLLQHRSNPVDWYPWGAEAFEVAKSEDKPVFVSIGYAACHWCHVMAHECFENEEIASLMNELFVNVKIDREERPDVDAVYMAAIHVMGEGGGWPLSAFCDSDGRPFYLGTYFPPEDKYGRPGFPRVLRRMAAIYKEQRSEANGSAEAMLRGVREIEESLRSKAKNNAKLDVSILVGAGRRLGEICDPDNGGFGRKPKFPSPSAHLLLARCSRLPFGEPALAPFLKQAEQMARGGIYDHVGGGFARYSVDARWLVPHFEKMLYDNGQLLQVYAEAHTLKPELGFERIAVETVAWLEREMQDEAGGLYASLDADSEGEEGKFYVWTPEEVEAVLGAEEGSAFCSRYDVTRAGNFEHQTSIPSLLSSRGALPTDDANSREKLLTARAKRIRPGTDDKVLTSWNALAVSGLLRVWHVFGSESARDLASRVMTFLLEEMCDGSRVSRVFRGGEKRLLGTLDDYAFLVRACFDMAESASDAAYWEKGMALLSEIVEKFYEEQDGVGVFYMTAEDRDSLLVHRPESYQDGAIPSGAAIAVDCLVRASQVCEREDYRNIAESYLRGRGPQAGEQPFSGAALLGALDTYLHGVQLVVTEGQGREELLSAARKTFCPGLSIVGSWASASLLAGKVPDSEGRARAYVCQGQSCAQPVSSPSELAVLLRPSGIDN